MSRNILFLGLALIGLGLFIIPSTLSMFAGQHSWYDPSDRGLPCDKCHLMERYEIMGTSGPHSTLYGGVSKKIYNSTANYNGTEGFIGGSAFWGEDDLNDRCYGCHQVGASFPITSPLNLTNTTWADRNDTVHAAIVIYCVDCHSWVDDAFNESLSSHNKFYYELNTTDSGLVKGGNSACIGCHTSTGVNVSWTRRTNITFTADKSDGSWSLSNMNATGNKTNITSNLG